MPEANTFPIGIFAVLAQHERELISGRAKAALQVKKAQGARLDKPENLTVQARAAASQALRNKAAINENNRRAASLVQAYRQQSFSWLEIAGKLNEAGFKTSRGGDFQAVQVRRIHERISR
jgi:DNA invertase Pin-like site-specific DNA recombinase